jgi:hypothetical protein
LETETAHQLDHIGLKEKPPRAAGLSECSGRDFAWSSLRLDTHEFSWL